MKRLVWISPVIAALLIAVSFAACTSAEPIKTNGPVATTAAPSAEQTAAPTGEPPGPLTKYDPGITLTLAGEELDPNANFPAGMDRDNNPWKTIYKEALGITFENKWVVPGDKVIDKLNTQIAAGDIPDILNGLGGGTFGQLKQYGLAAPLEGLIDQYATDLCKQALNSDGGYSLLYSTDTDSGHIYALPYVYGYTDNVNMMWIRTDWLKKVNKEAPKTLDQLYDLLKAFATTDLNGDGKPGDSKGLTTESNLWEVQNIFNAYGAQPFWSWYKDTDGKLKYSTVYKPEASKQALTFLNKLYAEGLLDPEFGTVNADKYVEDITSGKVGICFREWWFADTLKNTVANFPEADWQAYPIPTGFTDGSPAHPNAYYGPAAYNVVSVKCEHPEAIVKLLNLYVEKAYGPNAVQEYGIYMRSDNGFNMAGQAVVGLSWANKTDTFANVAAAVEANDGSKLNSEEKSYFDDCVKYLNGDKSQWAVFKKYGPNNAMVSVIDYYTKSDTPFFGHYYGKYVEAAAQYADSLDAKWVEASVAIIMGSKPVSAYDDFVKDWYALGGDKIEQETNDYAAAHPDVVKIS